MLFLARERAYMVIIGLVVVAAIVIACLLFLPVVMSGNVPM